MKLTDQEKFYLRAKESYYDGAPIISDDEFDILEAELKEANSPAIEMVGFKTKGVIVKHLTPMKSLDKIQFQEDFIPFDEFTKWLNQNSDSTDSIEASGKFDGNAVNLIYKAGKLYKGVTRGDGDEGQDITAKVRSMVPNTIPLDKHLEIRGEIVIKLDTFNKKYGPGTILDYKNPRNFVAGMLNRDNLEKSIAHDLDFMGFEIKMGPNTWMGAAIGHLYHWGFQQILSVDYNIGQLKSENSFVGMYESFTNYRKECPYQLDGWVLKFGNNMRTPDMEKDHHPKWALAVKFPPKIAQTEILDIEWNLGSTGILVPTGILKPVDLDGSTVQRVILHNYEWAQERGLGIGAFIKIVKSGDIIPKVHEVLKKGDNLDINLPTEFDGQKVIRDGVHIRVENPEELPAMKILKMHRAFVALGMKGLGLATAEKIFFPGVFETIEDIFDIEFTEDVLIGFGNFVRGRELEIVMEIVNEVKEIEYWKVINSLGVTGCGKTLSKQAANYLSGVDYDFAGLEKAIVSKFTDSETSAEYNRLKWFEDTLQIKGVKIIYPEKIDKSQISGTMEMTGSPKEHGFKVKNDFVNLAAEHGFIHDKLTKDSSFLITDDYNGKSAKMTKANKLGVEIITYSDFAKKYLN